MTTTIGQVLVNDSLPPDTRDYLRTLNSTQANKLLERIAREYPEKYNDIAHELVNLGRNAAFTESATLSLDDMQVPVDREELFEHVRAQTRKILDSDDLTDEQKQRALVGVYGQVQKHFTDETYKNTLAKDNPFALQVESKARGNPSQLAALMTTPGTYTDAYGNVIPTFIKHSYAEGLDPHEYWAATYGARKGVISSKFATREAGDLGKQFNQAAMRMVVTDDDCGTDKGIPVNTDDKDTIGAVLARDAGKYPAGTVVSKEVLEDLKDYDSLVVRSPLTCSLPEGLCARCTGLRESGVFPSIGDHVGVNASSALAERIAQGSLNVKHGGGQTAGDDEDKVFAGFDIVEQLFQVPKSFPDRAAMSNTDGKIESIEDAPQGGKNIVINGETHYVLPGMTLKVEEGDTVEAGDQLSDGIVNPREVVEYKGLGEGRRYFTERATKAFRDSGYAVNRRNIEVLVRGMLDNAIVNDPEGLGDYLPGDVTSYNALANSYKPRPDAEQMDVNKALGSYLEQPVLHHSIGTRVTRKLADQLKKFGHNSVMAHKNKPDFEPYMFGLRAVPQQEKDWMAQLGSSHLTKNLLKNVQRSSESHLHGLHPVPGLAKGVEFGKNEGPGY